MRLKEIEARVVKLEAARKAEPYVDWTEDELTRAAQRRLDGLIGKTSTFAGVVAELEASGDPLLREGARLAVQLFGDRYGYTAAATT